MYHRQKYAPTCEISEHFLTCEPGDNSETTATSDPSEPNEPMKLIETGAFSEPCDTTELFNWVLLDYIVLYKLTDFSCCC